MKTACVRAAAAVLVSLCAMSWSAAAWAYRPVGGPDPAVADPGELEVELGPIGYLREGSERSLIAPAVVLNYGFSPGWEAVLEGEAAHGISAGHHQSSLVGNGAFLKGMLREGSLQDKPGASIASEFGVLLPGINDQSGTGGSIAGIVSQRWPWLTIHVNVAGAVTRQQHGDLFVDAIVEGPYEWPVRPVAEVFHEHDFGRLKTTSGLIGAIWQVRDNIAIDAGLRHARINGNSADEVRAGITFSFPIGEASSR